VRSAPIPATGKISIEVSTDVQMVVWRGSVLLKNEVHDMLLSAVSVLIVAHSSSEIPEGLMNNPVLQKLSKLLTLKHGSHIAAQQSNSKVVLPSLTHCRRLTQKCVIVHPCVVDGPRISAFFYTTSNTRIFVLASHTDRFKVIVSYMQDVWISSYKQTDCS